jgi:aspartyl-tRNA(Asn)/glutamyl-tRNA(Gln) amidotransferase subunit C
MSERRGSLPTIDRMSERISREEVAHVATLARLSLTDDELDTFTGQLAKVLGHAEDVERLQLDDVPPTSHPYPLTNVLRADVVGPTLTAEQALEAAPAAEDAQFRVPPILGEAP